MQKLAKLLVATDLSHRSDRAMRRAVALAKAHDAELIVVSVLDDELPEDMIGELHARAERRLEGMCETLGPGVRHSIDLRKGDPSEELREAQQAHQPLDRARDAVFFDGRGYVSMDGDRNRTG